MRFGIAAAVSLALCASLVSAAQRLDARAVGEAREGRAGELVLDGRLHGEVRGTLRATLLVDGASPVAGDWTVTLLAEHGDGSTSEAGALVGRIAAGTVLSDGNGIVGLRDLQLVVTGGRGEYAGLAEGDGTLDVHHLGPAGEPFQASLSLTF
jgi:hypothetical protein